MTSPMFMMVIHTRWCPPAIINLGCFSNLFNLFDVSAINPTVVGIITNFAIINHLLITSFLGQIPFKFH